MSSIIIAAPPSTGELQPLLAQAVHRAANATWHGALEPSRQRVEAVVRQLGDDACSYGASTPPTHRGLGAQSAPRTTTHTDERTAP